jgi:hypothetical protein
VNEAAALARFASRFAVPFLDGKCVTVGTPLGVDGHQALRHGMQIDRDLVDATVRQLGEAALFSDVTPAPFDEDAATLLYAAHDLIASCHPQTTSFYARAHTFCEAATEAVHALEKTLDPARLVTRHLIVDRAFRATRTDIHVSWWAGRASFYGDAPPTRLTAWPGLRRVDVDKKTTPLWRLSLVEGDEETRVARSALLVALLHVSPLTALLELGEPVLKELGFPLTLPFRLHRRRMSPLDVLDDTRLARAVTDKLLERGVDHAGSMLALSILQGMREGAPPVVVRRAAELCAHLFLMMCVIEAMAPGTPEARPLRALLDEEVTKVQAPVRVYWSTVRAVAHLTGSRFLLPALDELPHGAEDLVRKALQRLEHKHIVAVGDPLCRELERRLPRYDVVADDDLVVEGPAQPTA